MAGKRKVTPPHATVASPPLMVTIELSPAIALGCALGSSRDARGSSSSPSCWTWSEWTSGSEYLRFKGSFGMMAVNCSPTILLGHFFVF